MRERERQKDRDSVRERKSASYELIKMRDSATVDTPAY